MTEPTEPLRLWTPSGLEGADPAGLSYVVVDEIEGGTVGLAVSDWPRVDAQGRLRFGREPVLLGAERVALERFLAEHRRPAELAERPLRIGDAFGVRARAERLWEAEVAEARLEPVLPPEEWIEPPVYDVTPEARDAAKASFYAAVTPALTAAQVAGIEELIEQPPAPAAAPPPPPPPPPPPGWWRSPLVQIVVAAVVFGGGLGAGIALGGQTQTVTSTSFTTQTDRTTSTDVTTETRFTTSTDFSVSTIFTTSTEITVSTVFTTVEVPAPPPPPSPG